MYIILHTVYSTQEEMYVEFFFKYLLKKNSIKTISFFFPVSLLTYTFLFICRVDC